MRHGCQKFSEKELEVPLYRRYAIEDVVKPKRVLNCCTTMRCMVSRKPPLVRLGGHSGISWPLREVDDEVWILVEANTPFLSLHVQNTDKFMICIWCGVFTSWVD